MKKFKVKILIGMFFIVLISCKEERKPNGVTNDGSISLPTSDLSVDNENKTSDSNQANNAAKFLKQMGVKANVKDDDKAIILTYDHRTKAIRISGDDMPSDSYMDTEGYMYMLIPKQGWVKINPSEMIGQLPITNILNLPAFAQSSNSEEMLNNRFGPIVDWPLRMTPEALSKNVEFEKTKGDCLDGNGKCIEFKGISGVSKGARLLFDKQEKLVQISYQNSIINYEYDTYDVQLPEAKKFSYGK